MRAKPLTPIQQKAKFAPLCLWEHFRRALEKFIVWREYRRYNLSFSQATNPYCSFFPPGKVILILQDESLMACLCGQADCLSYSGAATALQVFWSISCVQIKLTSSEIKLTSSWHNYLGNGFASILEQVPRGSSWDSTPLSSAWRVESFSMWKIAVSYS